MERLTLQALIDGKWHSAASMEFPEEAAGDRGACHFEYDEPYLDAWVDQARHDTAACASLPLTWGPSFNRTWPAFLDDLRPMGSARRWWLRRLNLPDTPSSDLRLLREGTVAPVGNLRIAEAVPSTRETPRRFPLEAVVEREHDFIAWAAEHGAQVGGATGAGGDSPKLLLRREPDAQVWIDTHQDEPSSTASHVLVKFARSRSERDRLILRAEHVYYRALARLGIDTISGEGLELREGAGGPSLWLPRFDVRGGARLGLESVYSLLNAAPGTRLDHRQVLTALQRIVPAAERQRLTVEYVQRDLLNVVFGNSDNHGRNTAVLKRADGVWLAPVFDFAPMKLDLEGIARSTTWGPFERGGDVDWRALLPTFGRDEEVVREGLHALAVKLETLPSLLRELGLAREVLEFPSLTLADTANKLRAWGLL